MNLFAKRELYQALIGAIYSLHEELSENTQLIISLTVSKADKSVAPEAAYPAIFFQFSKFLILKSYTNYGSSEAELLTTVTGFRK